MPTFVSPSGREYEWNKPSPPTKEDIDAIVAYDSSLGGQPAPQPANPVQKADSELMQAVNRSAGIADPLLGYIKQSQQPQAQGQAVSQYVNPAIQGGEEVRPPSAVASPEAKQRLEQGLANIPRIGVPAVAGLAAGPAGVAATSAVGSIGAVIGEAVSQAIEKLSGMRQEYSGKELVASGVQGAVPVAQGAGFLRGVGNVAMQTAGGMAGQAIRTDGEQFLSGGLLPGGISALAESVGGVSRFIGRAASGAAERAATLEKIGVEPTFGQAVPGFAAMESRVFARIGGEELRNTLAKQNEKIANTVRELTGIAPEESAVVTKKLLQSLGTEEAQAVANASTKLSNAQDILERVRSTAQEQAAAQAVQDATQEYQQAIEKTLFKGGKPDAFRIVKAGRTIEGLVDDARTAFKNKADELYAPIEPYANAEGFDLALRVGTGPSVTQEAGRILSEYPQLRSGGPNRAFTDLAADVQALQDTKNPLSLNQLRQMREKLYAYADTAGEAFGTKAQRDIRGLAGKITQSIDDQAARVFGTAANNPKQGDIIAKQLREANVFYRQFRNRFDEYGVAQAFKPETQRTGQMAGTLSSEVQRQGINAPAYENLVSLIDDLGKQGVKNAPSSGDVATVLRSALVEPSVNVNTGDIDFTKLADTLNTVERQSPGALSKLGFGSKSQLDRFVKLINELKDKPGPEKLMALLDSKSPTGIKVASEAIRSLPDFQSTRTLVSKLEDLAKTNQSARDSLLALRAFEIERILVETATGGRGPRMAALGDFADSKNTEQYRSILGENLFKRITEDFLPGYKRMLEYRNLAGQSAATVRGSAEERVLSGAGEAVVSTASGKPAAGVLQLAGDLTNLAAYKTFAKVLAKAGGATGYKSRADFLRTLEDVSRRIGSSGNITAIQKYADSGELPEEK